jgi:PhoH-like ATPase
MFAPQKEQRKNFVIDTSVLIHQKEAVHSFDGSNLYIPIEVLEEIDNLKTRMDNVGSSCRYVNRFLDNLRINGNLASGIKLDNDQIIYVTTISDMLELPEGMNNSVDNRIISVAKKLSKSHGEVTVVSRDISLRVRCDSLNIKAINFENNSKIKLEENDFSGIRTIETTNEKISQFYEEDVLFINNHDFYPNEGVVLKCGQSSALSIASSCDTVRKFNFAKGKGFKIQGVTPRSKEQFLALELLLDPDIHMVSLSGFAGCGKTFITMAAALQHLDNRTYEKLIISRPVQSTSKDIGFLPGTKEEKMAPWLQPIFDNFDVLISKNGRGYIEMMMNKGIIEVEALSYVRGRTLPNTLFVIDEAQNITHHEAKALLTRMGENSKIVLIGDLEQIDSPNVNELSSGLSSVIDLFKEFEHSGHVKLVKGERSKLASFAAKVM